MIPNPKTEQNNSINPILKNIYRFPCFVKPAKIGWSFTTFFLSGCLAGDEVAEFFTFACVLVLALLDFGVVVVMIISLDSEGLLKEGKVLTRKDYSRQSLKRS